MLTDKTKDNPLRMIALVAILDAVTSQIYIDYLVSGFRVSVSVILLPVIYYYYRRLNPFIASFFIGGFGLLFRSVVGASLHGGIINAFLVDYQIFIFDICYGILFYLLFYKAHDKSIMKWFFSVWICDFTANLLEMTLRVGPLQSNTTEIINNLITIGFFRTVIACFIVLSFKYYQLIFQKEAKYEKYRAFYTVFADLKSETYFMKENMDYIEDVMSEAYQLYEHFSATTDENAKQRSLKIAKDIHEIKKNYIKVIDGINKIGHLEENYDYLEIREILQLLHDFYHIEKTQNNITIEIEDHLHTNYKIKKHFLLMSVLRNLVSNSIEAVTDSAKKHTITISLKENEESLIIVVRDTGQGIKEKDLHLIFEPGYSTKFNEVTGDIYRGLGLTLVRDIIINQFNGKIDVMSKLGIETVFTIELDKDTFGG